MVHHILALRRFPRQQLRITNALVILARIETQVNPRVPYAEPAQISDITIENAYGIKMGIAQTIARSADNPIKILPAILPRMAVPKPQAVALPANRNIQIIIESPHVQQPVTQ